LQPSVLHAIIAPVINTGSNSAGMNPITRYLKDIEKRLAAGRATEHTHRPALQALAEAMGKHVVATNEPTRVACGAPDFIVAVNGVTAGYIEAKDIGRYAQIVAALRETIATMRRIDATIENGGGWPIQ